MVTIYLHLICNTLYIDANIFIKDVKVFFSIISMGMSD